MKDEWDRDKLHVTYQPQQITVERMRATIAQLGFEAEVESNPERSGTNSKEP